MAAFAPPAASARQLAAWLRAIGPGLIGSLLLAELAIRVRAASGLPALNPVVVALVLGMGLRAIFGVKPWLRAGTTFAVRPLLRAAIVLLGLQITAAQLLSLGLGALVLAAACVAATIPFTLWLGRALGVRAPLAQLIAAGTGICGASAIVAANQVVRGEQEDVAYALAVITLCGTASLLLFPELAAAFGLGARVYGLWAGASIHEVVQAVGAAEAGGRVAVEVGTITKLARVMLLAPTLLALGTWLRRRGARVGAVKAPIPWFAFGFLAMAVVASLRLLPDDVLAAVKAVVPLLLSAAVAALGLNTDLRALRRYGMRPLALGIGASVFIAVLGLAGAALVAG